MFNLRKPKVQPKNDALYHSDGFVISLQDALQRFVPGIQIFQAMNSDHVECWVPSAPIRARAEKACDEAWEKTHDRSQR